jgi:hypothetical protein
MKDVGRENDAQRQRPNERQCSAAVVELAPPGSDAAHHHREEQSHAERAHLRREAEPAGQHETREG